MYDVDLRQIQTSSGTYYNSVTDTYSAVPVGSYSGNGSTNTTDVGGMWAAIGGVGTSIKETVVEGVNSVTNAGGGIIDSITSKFSDFASYVEGKAFMLIGVLLLVIWVVAKSGILSQAAPFLSALAV